MNILVRMPNWLGDAVMATPALNNIKKHFPDAQIILLASGSVTAMFEEDTSVIAISDKSKQSKNRVKNIFAQAKELNAQFGEFEHIFVFTNSISTTFMMKLLNSKNLVGSKRGLRDLLLSKIIQVDIEAHQAVIYNQIVNGYLKSNYETGKTSLVASKSKSNHKRLGINAGASYGTAKRWDADRFAEVAVALSKEYEIMILGAPNEKNIATIIENILIQNNIKNYQNLVGKTSLKELLSTIACLDLFITNDSGPMHIAGAFSIPTVAIFGPTKHEQTYQWGNPKFSLLRKEIECAPCMKRDCPLKHHECMKMVSVKEVLQITKMFM